MDLGVSWSLPAQLSCCARVAIEVCVMSVAGRNKAQVCGGQEVLAGVSVQLTPSVFGGNQHINIPL